MKIAPPTIKTATPFPTRVAPPAAAAATVAPTTFWRPVAVPENLMPYEAVAKAIFVRANGLPAYYKATGLARRTAD